MILGMTTQTFTVVHTALSLIGIVSGFVVMYGLLSGKGLGRWTALFVLTTVLTSVTGFFFPFDHLLPSHKVGIISLLVLAFAILARYPLHLAGRMASDLRADRGDGSLPQRFRPGRAKLPQSAGPTCNGPDAARAAILGHAVDRSGALHLAGDRCGKEISQRAGPGSGPGSLTRSVDLLRSTKFRTKNRPDVRATPAP
jgi:hypothetical protein